MNKLLLLSCWEDIMNYVTHIETLSHPLGTKGYFVVRISRWRHGQTCIIDFYEERVPEKEWIATRLVTSTELTEKKRSIVEAVNTFVDWYNKLIVKS